MRKNSCVPCWKTVASIKVVEIKYVRILIHLLLAAALLNRPPNQYEALRGAVSAAALGPRIILAPWK